MARITTHGVSGYSDFVVDEIVARCSDDLCGAVKALMLINEHLEAELNRLRTTGSSRPHVEHTSCCTDFSETALRFAQWQASPGDISWPPYAPAATVVGQASAAVTRDVLFQLPVVKHQQGPNAPRPCLTKST